MPSAVVDVRERINALLSGPFIMGLCVLLANIGSRFLVLELSHTQEQFLSGEIMRKVIIFAAAFVATRDVLTSLMLVAAFTSIVSGLFHENSQFCVLPSDMRCGVPTDAEVTRARALIARWEAAQQPS